jgi:16S rRNA (uracil1498-N3)-methyltransferase
VPGRLDVANASPHQQGRSSNHVPIGRSIRANRKYGRTRAGASRSTQWSKRISLALLVSADGLIESFWRDYARQTSMRLHTEHQLALDQPIPLTAPQAHYLRNVMRASPGDSVVLFNGRDGEWIARIETISKRTGSLTPNEKRRDQNSELGPWLLFAPIKRAPLDFLVQKAVELGVSTLQPIITDYTNSTRIKFDRLHANVIEAAEQCERLTVPTIQPAKKLKDVLENWPAERRLLVCTERGKARGIEETLRTAPANTKWGILIGPEGGFASAELDLIAKHPFVACVSLGPRILRAETAALAALTCWQMTVGDWRNDRTS